LVVSCSLASPKPEGRRRALYGKKAINPVRTMASELLNAALPSSGWPDARHDNHEADDGSGDRNDGI